jgi:hypothetical protein
MNRITSSVLISVLVAACASSSADSHKNDQQHANGDGDHPGGDGDHPLGDGDLIGDGDGDGDHASASDGTIKADTDQITVEGKPASVHYSFVDSDGKKLGKVMWTSDDTRIGSISSDGTFTANGYVGGEVKITALVGKGGRSTTLTVDVKIVDNPGKLSDGDKKTLDGGGSSDGMFRWLYPYTGTVFPRGVAAPSLQLDGTAAHSAFLEITAPHYSYKQYTGASDPTRIALRAEVWRGLTLTVLPKDAAKVQVTKESGGEVTGPAESSWHFAPQDLTGIVYYSTYNYKDKNGSNGAIMRIRAGKDAEVVQSGCTVCHTVSAKGNVLATGVGYWADGVVSSDPETFNPTNSATFNLDAAGGVAMRDETTDGRTYAFMALTPDGKRGMRSGIPAAKWPPLVSRGVYAGMGLPSQLIDTASGSVVAAPTLDALIKYAQTPAFSPDGKHMVFLNGDVLIQDSNNHVISTLDVDLTKNPPVFSNINHVVERKGTTALAWPVYLPDGNGVVFHEGDSLDSSKFNSDANGPAGAQYAELRLGDAKKHAVNPLNALNGRDSKGNFYLPYGEAEEGRMNYEPSVLPVPVGGYYWVLFASRRTYGNTIAPGGTVASGDDPWGKESAPSPRKKIWIAAIDVNYTKHADPSHPAFYLPGQGLEAGNMRAYAALAPCKKQGQDCQTGSDCCDGFCRETSRDDKGLPILQCVPPPDSCSNIDEPCQTAKDCCDPGLLCINNVCATVTVL